MDKPAGISGRAEKTFNYLAAPHDLLLEQITALNFRQFRQGSLLKINQSNHGPSFYVCNDCSYVASKEIDPEHIHMGGICYLITIDSTLIGKNPWDDRGIRIASKDLDSRLGPDEIARGYFFKVSAPYFG
ncbi:MAG TPA: hypothetical protein VFF28_01210 [Candidatus Nanoarchaeia archaeon]|nr:hypothetical protein [Candidatus Nanoarchaeia archaeon]